MYHQRKLWTLLQPQKGGISSIWEEISPTHTIVSIVVWYITKNNTSKINLWNVGAYHLPVQVPDSSSLSIAPLDVILPGTF